MSIRDLIELPPRKRGDGERRSKASVRTIVLEPGPVERNPGRAARRERLVTHALSLAIPLSLVLLWQLAAVRDWIDVRFFPAPTTILDNWGGLMEGNLYWEHLWASTRRIVQGFVLGSLSGLAVGLAIGRLKIIRKALEPLIIGFYSIPKLAILPLLLLIFGIGETPKVLLIAFTVFFIVLINTSGALESVVVGHLEAAKSFGLNRIQTVRHVIVPSALPQIFVGLRLSAGIAVLVVVGAEFVAAERGLGFLIWNAWNLGIPSYMYIGIISISTLGVFVTFLLRLLEHIVTPWQR